MTRYANILETVGRTPVVKLSKLAPPGIDLYVKVEAFNPHGSVKDRLALGVIEAAEKSGRLKPGQTVIEATSGNTGIGLAMVCAQKGYPLVVTMAESFSVERRKLMRFLGARVVLTPAKDRGTGMVAKAVELAEKNGWFLTRQFENEANPEYHEKTTGREIVDDFRGERLDYWVTGADSVAWSKRLARDEGIFVGISAGGTLSAAMAIAREAPKGTTLLAMLPDTGERYLSTPLFEGIGADMDAEERALSESTPGYRL